VKNNGVSAIKEMVTVPASFFKNFFMKKSPKDQLYFYKKVVPIPIYGGNFIIIFSNDPLRVGRIINMPTKGLSYLYAHTFHNFVYRGWESFSICLNFWGRDEVTLGTIVHEITHTGSAIADSRSLDTDIEHNESLAYLNGWLGDQIGSFMRTCNVLNKIKI
jgi:hypothetical protein